MQRNTISFTGKQSDFLIELQLVSQQDLDAVPHPLWHAQDSLKATHSTSEPPHGDTSHPLLRPVSSVDGSRARVHPATYRQDLGDVAVWQHGGENRPGCSPDLTLMRTEVAGFLFQLSNFPLQLCGNNYFLPLLNFLIHSKEKRCSCPERNSVLKKKVVASIMAFISSAKSCSWKQIKV